MKGLIYVLTIKLNPHTHPARRKNTNNPKQAPTVQTNITSKP